MDQRRRLWYTGAGVLFGLSTIVYIQNRPNSFRNNSPIKVAIIGHSYIRDMKAYLEQTGYPQYLHLDFFYRPGAKVFGFTDTPMFKEALQFKPQVAIVHIGGNDAHNTTIQAKIADSMIELCEILERAGIRTYCTELEFRDYHPNNRWGVEGNEIYSNIRRFVNDKLHKALPGRVIRLPESELNKHTLIEDGIHLNTKGLEILWDIYLMYINNNL